MQSIKVLAHDAKRRMKNNYWELQKRKMEEAIASAEEQGEGTRGVYRAACDQIKRDVKGQAEDEFYKRVKAMLDNEGEVSDALGRLTDQAHFATLNYEQKQRYLLDLSARYVLAVERYKKEKGQL